jgi:hypothetical protein
VTAKSISKHRGATLSSSPFPILRDHRLTTPEATATARDSSVVNTLLVLMSYWSNDEWIGADWKNGGPEENDDGEITSAQCRRRRPSKMQSAEDRRSVQWASMSSIQRRRPGETQRGAHGVDLAATSIQGEEKAWCSYEAS